MLQSYVASPALVLLEETRWLCNGCQTELGIVVLAPEGAFVRVTRRQLTARINLPVTFQCGCQALNRLDEVDIEHWQRRGGGSTIAPLPSTRLTVLQPV